MNIILLAAPGAGKGTQAELITSNYEFKHISTGDLLRNALNKDDDMSKLIKKDMEAGKLVSDEIILSLIKKTVDNKTENYLFDGFPRTINQAKLLDELFLQSNMKIDKVINIMTSKEELKKRIVGRITCPNCKAIYNVNFLESKPKQDGICDKCGSTLISRIDDSLETFENRYNTYLEETEPLIKYYKEQNKLIEINGEGDKYKIFDEIKTVLEGEL